MLTERFLQILACPVCKQTIRQTDEDAVFCVACVRSYPVHDDIPVMLTDEAEQTRPVRHAP